jgi:hypothetical protein
VPNVPLLGGFAAASGIIKLESVIKAINATSSPARWPTATSLPPPRPTTFVVAEMKEALTHA